MEGKPLLFPHPRIPVAALVPNHLPRRPRASGILLLLGDRRPRQLGVALRRRPRRHQAETAPPSRRGGGGCWGRWAAAPRRAGAPSGGMLRRLALPHLCARLRGRRSPPATSCGGDGGGGGRRRRGVEGRAAAVEVQDVFPLCSPAGRRAPWLLPSCVDQGLAQTLSKKHILSCHTTKPVVLSYY